MKPTTKAEMAIRGMFELALNVPSKPIALAKLAEKQAVSLSYLEQVFASLRKQGLVLSVRGPGGGYLLARPADQIFAGEIIEAVDGRQAEVTAEERVLSTIDTRLEIFWQAAEQSLMGALNQISLTALMDGSISDEIEHHKTASQAAE